MHKWLENDRIILRAMEPDDSPLIYRWENDTRTWHYGSTLSPYSRQSINEFVDSSPKNIYEEKQLRLMIQDKQTAKTVGMLDLFEFDPHHARAALGLYIDEPHKRNGYALEAVRIAEQYAFDFLHLHQLYAHIPLTNTPCINLFDRMDYKRTGVLEEWIYTPDGWKGVAIYQKTGTNRE